MVVAQTVLFRRLLAPRSLILLALHHDKMPDRLIGLYFTSRCIGSGDPREAEVARQLRTRVEPEQKVANQSDSLPWI